MTADEYDVLAVGGDTGDASASLLASGDGRPVAPSDDSDAADGSSRTFDLPAAVQYCNYTDADDTGENFYV